MSTKCPSNCCKINHKYIGYLKAEAFNYYNMLVELGLDSDLAFETAVMAFGEENAFELEEPDEQHRR